MLSAPLCQADTAFDLVLVFSWWKKEKGKETNPSTDLMSVKAWTHIITSYQELLFRTWNYINSSNLETLLLSQRGLIIINSMERTRQAPLPSCMHLLADCIDTLMLRWGDWCEARVALSIVSAALRLRECLRLNGPRALLRRCCLVSFKPLLAGHHVAKGHLDNQDADGQDSSLSKWVERK